jgi:hypothetical protein
MKNTLIALSLGLASLGAANSARADDTVPTKIISNTIRYAQLISSARYNSTIGAVDNAAIGGKVEFTGPGPVYVTIRMGGQDYTALTDQTGKYSFWVYANSSRFVSEAWLPGQSVGTGLAATGVATESALSPAKR